MTENGQWFDTGEPSNLDLILVTKKSDIFDTLKIDDEVYVRDAVKGEWKKRYYAGKNDDGMPKAWLFGQTSRPGYTDTCLWKFWKVNGVVVQPE